MTEVCERGHVPGRPRDPAADEAILRAAFELFIDHGVEGANFEQIARRSGVSRATIYRRWKSRDDLLASALRSARKPRAESPDVIANMPPDELLDFLTDAFTDALTRPESPRFVARLIGSIPVSPELLAIYREDFVEPFWRAASGVLERARETGLLPHIPDQDLLLELLSGAITQRLLMRTAAPNAEKEKAWVERLMRQVGLVIDPA
jgi:AcrR family transcriptional regulator